MKFLFHPALALVLLVAGARASVTLNINSSGSGNATTLHVNGMAWGILISSDAAGIGGSFISDLSSALEGGAASPRQSVEPGADWYDQL